MSANGEALAFDPAELRARYRAERDKRLRDDGNAQYREVVGDLGRYLDDPYATAETPRAAATDAVEVVVIGGGFGGLLAGARLREAGVEGVRIIEKGADFGGTWYWNRYPGAACDIESYIYLPLLEETGFVPSEKYARGEEILNYSRQIGRHFDLCRDALFETEVTDVAWNAATSRWTVRTSRGDAIRARFVVMANGPLHRPKLPGIPGVESFAGHSFHTSRWDYAYTGGDARGGLVGLHGKRVGIIGTGATAVQCVPHLAQDAGELFVFQRTPSSIDRRDNRPTDRDWIMNLEPGWQQRRMDNFNILVSGDPQEEDMVGDGWTDILREIAKIARSPQAQQMARTRDEFIQLADFAKMEQIRARVDSLVNAPEAAEKLKPYYNLFCKRPCFHDGYLQVFNRPNVTLVDTDGRGVERITPAGVVVDGREYPLDCLIFATGFEVGTGFERRAGYQVHGRDGLTLAQKWRDGALSLHGMHVNGFPNAFIMSIVQAGFTANYPHALNEQAKHIAYLVKAAVDGDVIEVEATPDAEQAWRDTILKLLVDRRAFLEECTPGYYNNEGQPSPVAASYASYGAGSMAFFEVLRDWREHGQFAGLHMRPADHERAA